MHRFPRDARRRKLWEQRVRRQNWKASNYSVLCEDHFEGTQYECGRADGRRKLKPNAVPTVFVFTSSQNPKRPNKRRRMGDQHQSNTRDYLTHDHSYNTTSSFGQQIDGQVCHIGNEVVLNDVPAATATIINDTACDTAACTDNMDNVRRQLAGYEHLVRAFRKQVGLLHRAVAKERRDKWRMIRRQRQLKQEFSAVFTANQLSKLCQSSLRGAKWTAETIKKALKLKFQCGAPGYKLLLFQKLPLPSERSLQRRLQAISIQPGILHEIFDFLQLKVDAMRQEERECCLSLDEMSIQPATQYVSNVSCRRGDVTVPGHSGVATHALVVTLGGVTTDWKQTVAYHLTSNSVDGAKLKPLIIDILKRAKDIGLHVKAVKTNMGASACALWQSFGIVCQKVSMTINKVPHPVEEGRFLHFIADVADIIKNLTATLVNGYDITLGDEVVERFRLRSNKVTAKHVQMLIDFQKDKDVKLVPQLTQSILTPSHFGDIEVSLALILFGPTVCSALCHLVDKEGYDQDLLTTAWFLGFFKRWFDIMSSRHVGTALSQYRVDTYEEEINHLHSVILVMKNATIEERDPWKPVQAGAVLSTTSILDLQSDLLSRGHSFVLTSRFSQGCLESLAAHIRTKNLDPTALEVVQALKIITVTQFLKHPSKSSYNPDV